MPRRPRIQKRVILPDPIYTHEGVAKFVNVVMQRGKRSTAERVVYGSLDRIRKVAKKDPIEVFDSALKNATPVLEVKPRRIGGATYQVPVEIRPDRRSALARRWIVRYARAGPGRGMQEKLAGRCVQLARAPDQHARPTRTRRILRRGRAQTTRDGRGSRCLRCGCRRRAPIGDGLAPGRSLRSAPHRLHQQDGPDGG